MEQEEEENLDRLLKWAVKLGVSDSTTTSSCGGGLGHSLVVSYFHDAGGRGLAAAHDLQKGDLLLKVPKSALLTTQTLSLKHAQLSPTQRLSVYLLYEMSKGKTSWWHPYLINLPRSYDIIATFGEFEKQALQVDYAIWAAEKAISNAEFEWKEANEIMEQLKIKPRLRTFRAWLWASATVSSRTMHIPWDGAGCLCPVGDLFNYSAPGEEVSGFESVDHRTHELIFQNISIVNKGTSCNLDVDQLDSLSPRLTDARFENDVGAYCFYAKKSYRKGEQILLSYGTYTNLELLEHYGFLLNENPNDKAFVPLEPEVYSSCSWPKESLYIHQSGKPSFALLSALRLWATPANHRRSVGHLAYSGLHLSIENEGFVMRWIAKKCASILKNLPTSFEEDSLLLSAIDNIQKLDTLWELKNVSSHCADEICAFKASVMKNGERETETLVSRKMLLARERWRLAVEWRLGYKKMLIHCISHCEDVILSMSCQRSHPQI